MYLSQTLILFSVVYFTDTKLTSLRLSEYFRKLVSAD